MSNVIDSSHFFIAKRQYKPVLVPEYQLIRRDLIDIKPLPAAKCTKRLISKFTHLFYEHDFASHIILDELGVLIAGERYYHARHAHNVLVYVIAGLSETEKVAFRKAYVAHGGDHE